MAKRGGLGRGLDALIPAKKPAGAQEAEKEEKVSKKDTGEKNTSKKTGSSKSAPKNSSKTTAGTKSTSKTTGGSKGTAKKTAGSKSTSKKAAANTAAKEKNTSKSAPQAEPEVTAKSVAEPEEREPKVSASVPQGEQPQAEQPVSEKLQGEQPGGEQSQTEQAESQQARNEQPQPQASTAAPGTEMVVRMKISQVEPNRDQPRKYFDDEAINELADSIRQYGIIQPLLVQERDGYFEIIAGERRWRAARKANLKEVPVIVKNISSQEAVEVALVENIQREDLNPIEEAKAYDRLVKEYGLSQEAVAGRVSKSRSSVTNSLRLLRLDEAVQKMVETAQISEGHARAILGVPAPELQRQMAEIVVKDHLSVRQTEKLVRDTMKPREKKSPAAPSPETAVLNGLSENLKTALGTKVNIRSTGKNKGSIEIEYYSDEELDRLYEMLLSLG